MKTLYIPAKIKGKANVSNIKDLSKKLPKNLAIVYSIQFEEVASQIKAILSKEHEISLFSQVLGCSKPSFPKPTQAVLLVGSGKFHAFTLSRSGLPVYILEQDKLRKLTEAEIDSFERKQKSSYLKFLNSKNTGILISLKPGQENLKKALELKKKIKDKKSYLFLANNLDNSEFQNFPIAAWVNTACPRLDLDIPVLNIEDLI
jgi:diphthamide biosynthesis enzyme Dph1/Dph2-like protein